MKAPQLWRLERMVYNGFYESGMEAAHKRRSDGDSAVKAFMESLPQVSDVVLTLLRFEAFAKGWQDTLRFDREESRREDNDVEPPSPSLPSDLV